MVVACGLEPRGAAGSLNSIVETRGHLAGPEFEAFVPKLGELDVRAIHKRVPFANREAKRLVADRLLAIALWV